MAVGIALDLVEPNDVADIGGLIRLLGERGAHAHQNCKEHIWLHEVPRFFTSVNKATTIERIGRGRSQECERGKLRACATVLGRFPALPAIPRFAAADSARCGDS